MTSILFTTDLALISSPSPSSASGRLDDDPLAWLHLGGILTAKANVSLVPVSVGFLNPTHPEILATLGIFAPFQTVRVVDSTFGKDGNLHRDAKFNISDDAVSSAVLSSSPRIWAKAELSKQNGISPLKHLRVGNACVGHVRVYPRSAFPVGTCTAPTGDGFVVAKPFLFSFTLQVATEPKSQVVGIALGGSTGLKAIQNDIGYTLALAIEDDGQLGQDRWFAKAWLGSPSRHCPLQLPRFRKATRDF